MTAKKPKYVVDRETYDTWVVRNRNGRVICQAYSTRDARRVGRGAERARGYEVTEPILIQNRIVYAELIYISGRGDYRVYKYNGKLYRVQL